MSARMDLEKKNDNAGVKYRHDPSLFGRKEKFPHIIPPNRPRLHSLGSEFGNSIREFREKEEEIVRYAESRNMSLEETFRIIRPHVRRPHRHHYWTGSEAKGNRKLVVHFLPPIFVGNVHKYLESFPERAEENSFAGMRL